MADVYRGSVAGERRHHERRASWIPTLERGRLRVSWGGIWAGMLITLGSLLLLTTLGLAVGITAVDPGDSDAGAFGTGAGIWGIVSALLALFVGGMVSTRSSAIADRGTSVFHGALVWLLTILVIAYLATSGIRMIAGGAFALAGGAVETASTVATTSASGVDLSGSMDEIAARIRDPQTAQRMASLTGLPLPEVQTHLERTAQNVEASGGDTQQAAQAAQQGFTDLMQRAQETGSLGRQVERQAEEAQPEAAAAAWGTLAALLLSLAAAVGGAMVGIKRFTARSDTSVAT